MRLASSNRPRMRTVVMACGCLAAVAIAIPGFAAAGVKTVQEVFVTNTTDEPVPVAQQGPVTVANQPEPPAQPVPIQLRLEGTSVSRTDTVASETVYTVPEGKLLTVEHAQLFFWNLASARSAFFYVSCDGGGGRDGTIHSARAHLPEIDGGKQDRIFAGPTKLLVPAGRCLKSQVVIVGSDLSEGTSVVVHGSITGHLSDL